LLAIKKNATVLLNEKALSQHQIFIIEWSFSMNAKPFNNTVYFSLTPYLYAATFDNAIIILDGKADKYLSLIDDAATFFRLILEQQFIVHNNGRYHPACAKKSNENDDYNYWISYFIDRQFIAQSIHPTQLKSPLQPGGLIGYRWDTKKEWSPFSSASIVDIIKAYWILARVHRTINKKGILGIITLIKNSASNKNPSIPLSKQIEKLSASVDAASLLYPKKTLCLAWAATFVILALRKNWKMNFVIGVQTNPFYAHAWAETASGDVINDDPLIAQTLAVILQEPYHQKDC
jgi:hypothetical protein